MCHLRQMLCVVMSVGANAKKQLVVFSYLDLYLAFLYEFLATTEFFRRDSKTFRSTAFHYDHTLLDIFDVLPQTFYCVAKPVVR